VIDIIPNWHPLLVHFTFGLLVTAVLFFLIQIFLSEESALKKQWLNMANWSLWTGCLFAIATVIAGWFAYNSVAHDAMSHAAMTVHRNWALPTASVFLLLGLWAIVLSKRKAHPTVFFLLFSLVAAGMLMFTGWLGAEAVYRYGLGVKSLPVAEEGSDGHNHSHNLAEVNSVNNDKISDIQNESEHDHIHSSKTESMQPTPMNEHNHSSEAVHSHTGTSDKNNLSDTSHFHTKSVHSHGHDHVSHQH